MHITDISDLVERAKNVWRLMKIQSDNIPFDGKKSMEFIIQERYPFLFWEYLFVYEIL